MELYLPKLAIGFQQRVALLPSFWLVCVLILSLGWNCFWHLAQNDNHLNGIMRSTRMGNPWHFNAIKNHTWYSQASLSSLEKGAFFTSRERKVKYLFTSRTFSTTNVKRIEANLVSTQRKIIAAYRASIHRLAIKIGWWPTSQSLEIETLCHSCRYNVVDNWCILCVTVSHVWLPLVIDFLPHYNCNARVVSYLSIVTLDH